MPKASRLPQPLDTDQQRIEAIQGLIEQVEAARQRYEWLVVRLRLVCQEARQ